MFYHNINPVLANIPWVLKLKVFYLIYVVLFILFLFLLNFLFLKFKLLCKPRHKLVRFIFVPICSLFFAFLILFFIKLFANNWVEKILTLGPFEIRYYGLVYAIGFLIAYLLLRWVAKNGGIKNFTVEKADSFILYLIIGAIVGARVLLFIFYYPHTLLSDPLEVFRVWHGGMSFHGGLVGAIIAGLIFCRKHKVNFYKLGDFMVLPLSFFLIFGRIANFINGELVGTKTHVSWCVVFPGYDGCRHPSQLYEALKNLVVFITLSILYFNKEIKKKLKDGIIFWLFVLLYGVLRFIITFWRDDPRFLDLSGGQYLCILMVIVSIYFLFRIQRNKKRENKPKVK